MGAVVHCNQKGIFRRDGPEIHRPAIFNLNSPLTFSHFGLTEAFEVMAL